MHPHDLTEARAVELLGATLAREAHAFDLLRRPEVSYRSLAAIGAVGQADWMSVDDADERLVEQVQLQVEVQAKYSGYIDRQQDEIERHRRHEETRLPEASTMRRSAVCRPKYASASHSAAGNCRSGVARAGRYAGGDLAPPRISQAARSDGPHTDGGLRSTVVS